MPPLFSGHETFPLRYAWLAKAVEATAQNGHIFSDDSAIATFGVGRNMVRSIKHWGLATGVLESEDRNSTKPSEFGWSTFGPDGWDPYCEDPGTLWVLHWHLCRDAGRAALWYFVFGLWRGHVLDLQRLEPELAKWLGEIEEPAPSASTLKRDFLCLSATYGPSVSSRNLEDSISCPLKSLGLLYSDAGTLHLREGHQRRIPPEVFAYAVIDYWERHHSEAQTLSIQQVLRANGAPGRIFLLSEEHAHDLVTRIEQLEASPFRYDNTAGIQQLYRTDNSRPSELLERFYKTMHPIS